MPIIFKRSLLRPLRPSATSAEFALDLSFLQQEFDLFRIKFPTRGAQTFCSLPQQHCCQSPILRYNNISILCQIDDLDVSFLGIVAHHNMVIRIDVVIKTGHRPYLDAISTSNFHGDSQNRFGATICIHYNLQRILPVLNIGTSYCCDTSNVKKTPIYDADD